MKPSRGAKPRTTQTARWPMHDETRSMWLLNSNGLAINGPEEINQEDFVAWTRGLKEGTLGTKQLGPMTIKKRVETLRAILQACKLSEQLDFVDLWKPDKEVKEITYWTVEELDAMDDRALLMFRMKNSVPGQWRISSTA